jgi:hypothetical protein
MSRKLRLLLSLSFALLIFANTSKAAANCSEATLHGNYGLRATGVNAAGNVAAVGLFTFDGRGNLAGTLFLRVGAGSNVVLNITGTYSVTPECIVTDTWNFNSTSSTHTSVIVDAGKGYYILNTTSGEASVISGEARKQLRGAHQQ